MDFLFASLGALAIAAGLGSLVGILISSTGSRTVAAGGVDGATGASVGQRGAPAARRPLRQRIEGAAPRGYIAKLERWIVLAGRPVGTRPGRTLLMKPLLALPVGLLAWLFITADPQPIRIIGGVVFTLLAFFVPELLLYNRATKRQEEITLALPDTLDQMTIAVEAGLGFEAAMAKAAANGRGPLNDELVRTLQDMSVGRARTDAYDALASRTSSQDLRRFTRSVIQADLYGIAIADVLNVQASEMRLRRRQRAEEKAMKVPVKVLFPLMFCILPVLFIVLLTPAAINAINNFMGI